MNLLSFVSQNADQRNICTEMLDPADTEVCNKNFSSTIAKLRQMHSPSSIGGGGGGGGATFVFTVSKVKWKETKEFSHPQDTFFCLCCTQIIY